MSNAHDDAPVLFRTRWALSYLCGPLTGEQITRLSEPPETQSHDGTSGQAPASGAAPAHQAAPATEEAEAKAKASRPTIPAEVEERFLAVAHSPIGEERLVYRPAIGAAATLHYVNARAAIDDWFEIALLAPLSASRSRTSPWKSAAERDPSSLRFENEPKEGATFSSLPPAAANAKSYAKWKKMLASSLYRDRRLSVWRSRKPALVSTVGESEGDFRVRLREAMREQRDLQVEKLRGRYAPKLARLQERIRAAEQRVEVEQAQYSEKKTQTAISIGATVVGALFGRKLGSLGNVGRATTAMRGAGRASRERGDIARAKEKVSRLRKQLSDLEQKFERDIDALHAKVSREPDVTQVKVACRKTDLDIQPLSLVWTPWRVGPDGIAQSASG